MGIRGRKSTTKSPPILSHEFVIQNHADIVSCIAMVFVIGLMVQVTSPIAYMFVAIHHNVSMPQIVDGVPEIVHYTYGLKDLCAVFFYLLISIVMHAIIQEYILDKLSKKLHLSKVKNSMFNESGQLLVFYILSVLWGGDVIFRENYLLSISSLWEGYPHTELTFMCKFFYIVQFAYWIHVFPEIYLQKTKKEDMLPRIKLATVSLLYISAAYLLNFSRVGTCLLVLHYLSEAIFHTARLFDFFDKSENENKTGYTIANLLFVLVRLGSIILSVLTFWYGLALHDQPAIDIAAGNFNTQIVRLASLGAVCLLQAWLMWNFITLQLKTMREQATSQTAAIKKSKVEKKAVPKKKKEEKRSQEDDDLPEVDQNTKKSLRSRVPAAKVK